MLKKAIVVCGPTASGKTEFAHLMATNLRGTIVNADSMQVYKQIPIITSSPAKHLQDKVDYHLYNFIDIEENFSAVKYTKLAADKIRKVSSAGLLPIIVGGSGLYIKTLTQGYSIIPEIDNDIKLKVKKLHNEQGLVGVWDQLASKDHHARVKLKSCDKQRIIRAFEVIEQTGQSIFEFSKNHYIPLPEFEFKILFLLPERKLLYNNCETRTKIIINSAIEEVQCFKEKLEKSQLASKAVGITQILSYLNNQISYQELINLINLNTRRYAKRQITWFNNQIPNKKILEYKNVTEFRKLSFN